MSCCADYTCAAGAQFDTARADGDLKRYRKRGADVTTRLLVDGVRRSAGDVPTLLDVGAGIGVLCHELMGAATSATLVDASAAYLRAAEAEAGRRRHAERCTFRHGDFVELAAGIAEAHTVTMDRVVCCYHAVAPLLDAALTHAQRLFAFSYPRDRWWVRLVVRLENVLWRIRRSPFRVFVHPRQAMHDRAAQHGFRLVEQQQTLAWCVEIWRRQEVAARDPKS